MCYCPAKPTLGMDLGVGFDGWYLFGDMVFSSNPLVLESEHEFHRGHGVRGDSCVIDMV